MRISSIGVVTAAGAGVDDFVGRLRDGPSLIGASQIREGSSAAELETPPKKLVGRKGLIPLSRSSHLIAAAVANLFQAQGAPAEEDCGDTCGLVVGTAYGHVQSKADFHETAQTEGPAIVSPIVFPNTIINSLAGHAAILFGLRGPNSTVTSGRRSGLEALLRAQSLLRAGRAERVVVGACDEVSDSLLRGLEASGMLAGHGGAGLYDSSSTGVTPGEAGIAVFLERGDGDGAQILGYGESNAVGGPLDAACEAAIAKALERAGVAAADVSWIALAGSGDSTIDDAEASALRSLDLAGRPSAAIKSIFGETFGAGGLLACAAAMVAKPAGFVPATPGALSSDAESLGLSNASREIGNDGAVLISTVDVTGATAVVLGV